MEDFDGGVHQLGQRDGAVRRLPLDDGRAGPCVVFRRSPPGGEQGCGAPGNGVVVLAMHRDQAAQAACGGQHLQVLPVVQAQGIVGQECLEAPYAGRDGLGQLVVQHGIRRIGDDLVEGVVHHRACRGAAAVLRQGLQDAAPLELRAERDDGGGATGECGGAAGDERLLVRAAALLQLLDVAMAVHATGQDEQSASVQRGAAIQALSYGGDPSATNANVGAEYVAGSHDSAALDDQVVAVSHAAPLRASKLDSEERVLQPGLTRRCPPDVGRHGSGRQSYAGARIRQFAN